MPELHRLGLLVLGHRGKLRKLELDFRDTAAVCQLLALRLAVILCHARREPDLKQMTLQFSPRPSPVFVLKCSPSWAKAYPQSAHLLREEVFAWQKMPCTLNLSGCEFRLPETI